MRSRVDHFEKRKAMEVGVSGTNPANTMFAHQDGGVGVMEQVAREMRKLGKQLPSHLRVPRGGNNYTQSRRVEQARHKLPRLLYAPRPSHHPRMSGHSQEFVKDRPSRVPRLRPAPLVLKPGARSGMVRRISVGSIDQDIGIDEDQCLPAFHRLVQRVPIGNIHQGAAAVEDRHGR